MIFRGFSSLCWYELQALPGLRRLFHDSTSLSHISDHQVLLPYWPRALLPMLGMTLLCSSWSTVPHILMWLPVSFVKLLCKDHLKEVFLFILHSFWVSTFSTTFHTLSFPCRTYGIQPISRVLPQNQGYFSTLFTGVCLAPGNYLLLEWMLTLCSGLGWFPFRDYLI